MTKYGALYSAISEQCGVTPSIVESVLKAQRAIVADWLSCGTEVRIPGICKLEVSKFSELAFVDTDENPKCKILSKTLPSLGASVLENYLEQSSKGAESIYETEEIGEGLVRLNFID